MNPLDYTFSVHFGCVIWWAFWSAAAVAFKQDNRRLAETFAALAVLGVVVMVMNVAVDIWWRHIR